MWAISFIVCPSASSCSTSRCRGLKLLGLLRRPGLVEEGADQPLSGQRRDVGTPLEHLLDGLEQLRGGRVLEQVAGRPGPEGLRGEVGILAHRQKDHLDRRA